jgi:lysophospholipase L1-like esterase
LGEQRANGDQFRASFERYFVRSKQGEHKTVTVSHGNASASSVSRAGLECAILATCGDSTTHLLFHLQNGLLAPEVQPKAWLFMIGTNNLGETHCSKRTTLSGILHVARYVHLHRPQSKVILHSLLPRVGPQPGTNFSQLGDYWQKIRWINEQLRNFVTLQNGWYLVENSDLFLATTHREDVGRYINATLMADGLHPSLLGYELLGPRLAKQLRDIVQ